MNDRWYFYKDGESLPHCTAAFPVQSPVPGEWRWGPRPENWLPPKG